MKNPKDKNTNINRKTKITCRLMVGASEGVEVLMIVTRRLAALPVTIVLYHEDVFLVPVVYTCVIFCILNSWSMYLEKRL